jgi:CheY-specific phosphatase CheX
MKERFIEAFVDAAVRAAAARLGSPVERGGEARGELSHAVSTIAVLVGPTGELQGRLMLDLDARAAAMLRGSLPDDRQGAADPAGDVTARALAALRSAGARIEATPPVVFAGRNLELTSARREAIEVPIAIRDGKLVVSGAGD